MKRILLFIASVLIITACQDPLSELDIRTDTTEDFLIAVENIYKVECFEEEENCYTIYFVNPTPIKLKKTYCPYYIELQKKDIISFTEETRAIRIMFKDKQTVTLSYESWLKVNLNKHVISFDYGQTSTSITFEIEDSDTESLGVEVSGCEKYANVKVTMNENHTGGEIIFTPLTTNYFTTNATITFSNGNTNKQFTVPVIMSIFKFEDGTVEKSYSFLEYERRFGIQMAQYDTTVKVIVPDDCASWVKTEMSNYNVNGVDETTIIIELTSNEGKTPRNAELTVIREGSETPLHINIEQIGAQMEGSFRNGLVAFYNALNGNNWNENENWCSNKPYAEWYGLSFNNDNGRHVYYGDKDNQWCLNTYSNNMRGTIPDEFWKITKYFSSIAMQDEYLPTSVLPDYVWNENLEYLTLWCTFINVPLTSAVANATNLKKLKLIDCNIAGIVPDEITTLGNLEELTLAECNLTGEIPVNIGNLKELKKLSLSRNNDLNGAIPESLYNLNNLQILDLNSTSIGGKLSPKFATMTSLEDFDISYCEFEGIIPEEMGTFLKDWNFDGNYFSEIPEFLRYRANGTTYGKEASGWDSWLVTIGIGPWWTMTYYRNKEDGRDNMLYKGISTYKYILNNGNPIEVETLFHNNAKLREYKFPIWAHIRYGFVTWNSFKTREEVKSPQYPYADDLQYPANEYYYDAERKAWCHHKLEYPAREYYKDFETGEWIHDASCPWDQEYIPEN